MKRLFGLASKDVVFPCVLFAIGMQKPKKNLCFFWFLVIFSNHRPSNKQKNQKVFVWFLAVKAKTKQKNTRKTKKTCVEAKPKSLFKVFYYYYYFLVLRFLGDCHSLHITSFKIYQDNKQGLYYLCVCVLYIYLYVCVLKDMIQEALRWISGGYHIYIDIYIYIYYMYMYVYVYIYIL